MAEPQIIPWKTITVEAVAIVVSILLAFAIDAWWAEKKENDVEQAALLSLHSDFVASGEQLSRVIDSLESAQTDFARFRSATTAELKETDPGTVRRFLTAFVKNHTFDPVTATLDALANDGRLGLISDVQLLTQLSAWQRELDNIEDISFELRAESVRMRRAMEPFGGPFVRWRQGPDDLQILQEADGETMALFQQDMEFMGRARTHQYALNAYVFQLHKLTEDIESIATLLDQNLSGR